MNPGVIPSPRCRCRRFRVGAENRVILCDLGVFVDQAAEPVPPQDPDTRACCRWMHTPVGGFCCSVRCGRWVL
jgi:hypothetical protein